MATVTEPVAWIIGRKNRNGTTDLCLPLLRGRQEMERYQQHNPDETILALFTAEALAQARAEGRAEGMREAAGIAKSWRDGEIRFIQETKDDEARLHAGIAADLGEDIRLAILAAIPQETKPKRPGQRRHCHDDHS